MRAEETMQKLPSLSDGKFLIVHADDLGITHSVNAATIKALETGLVNSGSAMVTCSWFPEIAAYANEHPDVDLGLHLTLTSERSNCRWGPVSAKGDVSSLVDKHGYFHQAWTEETRIIPGHVACELRAQMEKALAMGLRPSHLDSHQLLLYTQPYLFELLVDLAHEYGIPFLVSKSWFHSWPHLERMICANDVVMDHEIDIRHNGTAKEWTDFYTNEIVKLKPGITEMIVHLGYDDKEMQAFSGDRESWGASWRQRDFDFVTSSAFRDLLREHGVTLVTWRELGRAASCEVSA